MLYNDFTENLIVFKDIIKEIKKSNNSINIHGEPEKKMHICLMM